MKDHTEDDSIDFGQIRATSQGAAKSVEATLRGAEDPDGNEELTACELWGLASVLERPKAPDGSGACELIVLRRGDEIVGLATKDRRWQIDLSEGDVVIRAFGPSASTPRIHLRADGRVDIEASEVRVGGAAASAFVALANLVDDRLSSIRTTFNANVSVFGAHVHPQQGGGTTSAPTTGESTLGSLASVAATEVKAV